MRFRLEPAAGSTLVIVGDVSGKGDLEVAFELTASPASLPLPLFEIGRTTAYDTATIPQTTGFNVPSV